MKVTEVSVEVGRTASVNYQSARNSVGLRASLEQGDHAPTAIRNLQKQAVELLLGDNEDVNRRVDDDTGVTSVDVDSLDAAIRAGASARNT